MANLQALASRMHWPMFMYHNVDLVQAEAEKIADGMDLNYSDLSLEMRDWIRERALESLWPERVWSNIGNA